MKVARYKTTQSILHHRNCTSTGVIYQENVLHPFVTLFFSSSKSMSFYHVTLLEGLSRKQGRSKVGYQSHLITSENKNTKVLIIYSVISYALFFSAWIFGNNWFKLRKKWPNLKKIKQKLKTWACRIGKQQKSRYDVIKAKFSISEEKHMFF